jgi:hypothetical protein
VEASLLFNGATYATSNAFQTGTSFNTDRLNATIVPVQFNTAHRSCSVLAITPHNMTQSNVYLIDWPASAKPAGCRSYEMVASALKAELATQRVLPLFYGTLATMYDSAGPYVYVGDDTDALAVDAAGARALLSFIQTNQTLPVVWIEREPGPWNVLFNDSVFKLARWLFLVLVLLVDVYGLYRLAILIYQILHKQPNSTKMLKVRVVMANPFFRVYVLSVVLCTIGFFTANEQARPAGYQAFGLIVFVLNQLIMCGMVYAWGRLVNRIRPRRVYVYLQRMALVVGGLSIVGLLISVVGLSSPMLNMIFNLGLVIVLPGMTILLIVQQIGLCLLAFEFVQYMRLQGVSTSIILPFKRVRLIVVVILLVLVTVLVSGLFYFLASTMAHYLMVVFLARLAVALLQICILSIPNSIETEWQENVVQSMHLFEQESISSHVKVLDWLDQTQSEAVELEAA